MNKEKDAFELLKSLQKCKYKEHTVKIDDLDVLLASLTAQEVLDIFEISNKFSDVEAMEQSIKIETLVRSIIAIDGTALPTDITEQKRQIIGKFNESLVDILFNEYCENVDKSVRSSLQVIEDRETE